MNLNLSMSVHADLRMAQRNISFRDLQYVVKHGTKVRRAGALLFFLRKNDIPKSDRANDEITRLDGTGILVNDGKDPTDMTIITVIRNKNYLHRFRKKEKYNLKRI